MKNYFKIANIIAVISSIIYWTTVFIYGYKSEPKSAIESYLDTITDIGIFIAVVFYLSVIWFILKNFVDGKYNKDSYIININLTEK